MRHETLVTTVQLLAAVRVCLYLLLMFLAVRARNVLLFCLGLLFGSMVIDGYFFSEPTVSLTSFSLSIIGFIVAYTSIRYLIRGKI
jgi:hypothetical protein